MGRVYSSAAGVPLTVTLASIPDGDGRKSAYVDNSSDRFEEVRLTGIIRSGSSAPTVGTIYEFHLFTGDGATVAMNTDDNAGGDTAITVPIENAPLVITAVVTATTGKDFSFEVIFDITGVDEWSIAFINETGQTTDSTEANSFMNYVASKAAA